MSLIQLGRSALRSLIELVEVSRALVNRVGQRVCDRSLELARTMAQRNQQAVVYREAGVIDGVNGSKVRIEDAVDRAEVWSGVGLAVRGICNRLSTRGDIFGLGIVRLLNDFGKIMEMTRSIF